jgi:non-specific serine/threonine protein kinase
MGASVAEVKDTLFPNSPFPLWTAKSILWQTLLGLDYMLENAIAHGDVQPRNLLFTLEDLGFRSVAELEQDKDIPFTPVSMGEIDGVKMPKYIVPADSLIGYLDISRPFTVKVSDLGGCRLLV